MFSIGLILLGHPDLEKVKDLCKIAGHRKKIDNKPFGRTPTFIYQLLKSRQNLSGSSNPGLPYYLIKKSRPQKIFIFLFPLKHLKENLIRVTYSDT